jgi:16S rRNA (adenine1518-N6/adenine1519-N6)-dimethyltransferase
MVAPSYPSPASPGVRELLDKYNLRPRKGLGQNFLADPNILRKIVEAAALSPEATVLEIGPGLGMLTRFLCQAAGRVVAVELDEALVGVLRQELAHLPNLELMHGDILQLDPAALIKSPRPAPACRPARPGLRARGQAGASQDGQISNLKSPSYTVVANLPYYITSPVIRHVLEAVPPPRRVVLTVQREVAERIVARPGDMSLLAVSVQFYGQPRIVARIPAGAFVPPPKVDSAVIRVDTYNEPPVEVSDVNAFFHIVRAGFGQKRKQLKNALVAGLDLPAAEVAAALTRAGVDPQRRAQTLSLAEWASLARELESLRKGC